MMRHLSTFLLPLALGAMILQSSNASASENAALSWSRSDDTLAVKRGEDIVWQFNFGPELSKTFFHPVNLKGGETLTWEAPADHRWHHGIWFSWKMINGVNYWEENGKTGKSAGLSSHRDVKIKQNDDHSARIELDIDYHLPDKPVLLAEHRVIEISAPTADGGFEVDWTSTFAAKAPKVVLDRTPLPGQPGGRGWGGYAGLSVRMAKEVSSFKIVDSEGTIDKPAQQQWRFKGRAVGYSGTIGKSTGGIAMIDHPQNLNSPSPWYINRGGMNYFSPAVIYNKPHTLSGGETFTLRYRVIVHPGHLDPETLLKQHERFAETTSK